MRIWVLNFFHILFLLVWLSGFPVFRFSGLPVFWPSGLLAFQSSGYLVFRLSGSPALLSIWNGVFACHPQ